MVIQATKKGYQRSELGLIPTDWRVVECAELGTFYKGRGISTKDLVSDGLPCIMYGDIYVKFDTRFSNPDYRINEETAARSSRAKTGDLFFTGSGETAEEIGKCVVYQGEQDIYIGGDILALRPSDNYDSLYLSYVQNSKMLLSQKANLGQGYTVVHIYTEHIKSLKVPLPPSKKEQSAIAQALSDIDDQIALLNMAVKKKQNIKSAVEHLLITGKKRLEGFNDKWVTKKIADVFRVTRGQVLSMTKTVPERMGEHIYPVYSSQTKENGLAGYYDDYLFEDCITWTTDGANAGEVKYRPGKFYCTNVCGVLENKEGYSNPCTAAIFNSVSKKYVSYVGNPKLMNNVVAEILITIPPTTKEQLAISTVLLDMDSEITELETRLRKTRELKQGMMQKLLTGSIRLV